MTCILYKLAVHTALSSSFLLCSLEVPNNFTCKGSNSPLDVVSVVALNATDTIAKQEWWPSDEDDAGEGKNREDTIPNGTPLLQEDPSQE